MGIIVMKNFKEILKLFLSIFFVAKFGSKKVLKLFEITLNLPVNCCGTE